MMLPRSPYMYTVGKPDGKGGWLYLSKNLKTFTDDPGKARWYAYSKYAINRRYEDIKNRELRIIKASRDLKLCPAGGQKYRDAP